MIIAISCGACFPLALSLCCCPALLLLWCLLHWLKSIRNTTEWKYTGHNTDSHYCEIAGMKAWYVNCKIFVNLTWNCRSGSLWCELALRLLELSLFMNVWWASGCCCNMGIPRLPRPCWCKIKGKKSVSVMDKKSFQCCSKWMLHYFYSYISASYTVLQT